MIYNFSEWLSARKAINEDCDPFLHLQQKEGDFVYFGIHDLSKSYNQNGSLPSLDVDTIMKKIGQCVDADPVEQTIKVYAEKDPYHFGYHKLETKDARNKRKSNLDATEGTHEVNLPVNSLQDITHLFADGDLEGHKIWLVIDGNAKMQQNLMKEIRKKEYSKTAHPPESEEEKNNDDEALEISDHAKFTGFSRLFKQYNDSKVYRTQDDNNTVYCVCGGCWPAVGKAGEGWPACCG